MDELILDKKRFLKGLGISIFIGTITALIIIFITTNQDTWISLSYVNKKYLFFAFILMIFAAVIDALRIKMTVEAVNEKITFTEALKVYYISNFAGGITPFFSGTLPAQIYLFNKNIKNKMILGKATMVATIMPLIKTLVFSIFAPIIFFGFKRTMTNYTILSAILINGAILISLFFLFLFILAVKYPEKMLGIIFKIQHLPCISIFSRKEQISHLF
ncbi:MAG: lysylphosphatidylglycerol synthase domain-containing protein, partial [Atribacterota bacterium]|nr:lysylphosphatidylglycerol synthase domain-containing protein [Atribacterota bacterium]